MLIVENSCEAHAQVRKGIFRTTKKTTECMDMGFTM